MLALGTRSSSSGRQQAAQEAAQKIRADTGSFVPIASPRCANRTAQLCQEMLESINTCDPAASENAHRLVKVHPTSSSK